ncbi:hypothetical protein DLAC_09992 [Tieghemostelium lacteum]|uniref:Uncharacterized protein n=1 Tax=Tieghemostelium lacteum TaxID=361077 RepID=A0A151Z5U6_TIELA|nr:hypothetical protein DLAC_09992 [Tieghemostelium lacteum]|eukprot:KYQ89330.1 hypothetical protein DLAC_09992 [Tieghemostelium lacteum]
MIVTLSSVCKKWSEEIVSHLEFNFIFFKKKKQLDVFTKWLDRGINFKRVSIWSSINIDRQTLEDNHNNIRLKLKRVLNIINSQRHSGQEYSDRFSDQNLLDDLDIILECSNFERFIEIHDINYLTLDRFEKYQHYNQNICNKGLYKLALSNVNLENDHLKKVLEMMKTQTLVIDYALDSRATQSLFTCTSLTSLTIFICSFTQLTFENLLTQHPLLENLNIHSNDYLSIHNEGTTLFLPLLISHKNIKTLSLTVHNYTENFSRIIEYLNCNQVLTSLAMWGKIENDLSPEELINNRINNKTLHSLQISKFNNIINQWRGNSGITHVTLLSPITELNCQSLISNHLNSLNELHLLFKLQNIHLVIDIINKWSPNLTVVDLKFDSFRRRETSSEQTKSELNKLITAIAENLYIKELSLEGLNQDFVIEIFNLNHPTMHSVNVSAIPDLSDKIFEVISHNTTVQNLMFEDYRSTAGSIDTIRSALSILQYNHSLHKILYFRKSLHNPPPDWHITKKTLKKEMANILITKSKQISPDEIYIHDFINPDNGWKLLSHYK